MDVDSRNYLFGNTGFTTLAEDIDAYQEEFDVVNGAKLPDPIPGEITPLVLKVGTSYEVMYMTARVGNTCTVERGCEDTLPGNWQTGQQVRNCMTAGFALKLATPPAFIFFTSRPYAHELIEALQLGGNLTGLGGMWRKFPEAVQMGGNILGGVFNTVLLEYLDGLPEAVQITGNILSGVFDSVLVEYEDAEPEAVQVAGDILGGEFNTILIEYEEYPAEAVQITGNILGGEMT